MARSPEEILADPMASPEELVPLAEDYPEMVAAHPNCPPGLWRELAKSHPLEALRNPTLLLYSLEDPGLYSQEALEQELAVRWIDVMLSSLNDMDTQLWVTDCIERMAPLYEKDYPGDPRLRDVIQARRARAMGLTTEQQWWHASSTARSMIWEMKDGAARSAVVVATKGPARGMAWDIAKEAATVASLAVKRGERDEMRAAERVWQWRRLLAYLGEIS